MLLTHCQYAVGAFVPHHRCPVQFSLLEFAIDSERIVILQFFDLTKSEAFETHDKLLYLLSRFRNWACVLWHILISLFLSVPP